MGKKGTAHRRYSKEEKMKYVRLHLEEHLSAGQIEPYAALHSSKSLSEVEHLRLLAAKQEVEIARLKKGYWVEGVGANREYVTGSGKTAKFSKNSKLKYPIDFLCKI